MLTTNISTKELPKASAEQIKAYWTQARSFIRPTGYYHDIRSEVEWAVTEYMAYKDGYTIRDWDKVK